MSTIDVNFKGWVCNGYSHFNGIEFNNKSDKPCYVSENDDAISYVEMLEATEKHLMLIETKEAIAEDYDKLGEWDKIKDLNTNEFYLYVTKQTFKEFTDKTINFFVERFYDDEAWESYSTYLDQLTN